MPVPRVRRPPAEKEVTHLSVLVHPHYAPVYPVEAVRGFSHAREFTSDSRLITTRDVLETGEAFHSAYKREVDRIAKRPGAALLMVRTGNAPQPKDAKAQEAYWDNVRHDRHWDVLLSDLGGDEAAKIAHLHSTVLEGKLAAYGKRKLGGRFFETGVPPGKVGWHLERLARDGLRLSANARVRVYGEYADHCVLNTFDSIRGMPDTRLVLLASKSRK